MTQFSDKQVRQRLMARGVEELSDAELVSIVIGAPRGGEAIDVAEQVLSEGAVGELAHRSPAELRRTAGLGIEGAARLSAAFELGRRAAVAESEEQKVIRDYGDIVTLFTPLLGGLSHEEMWVLYLSSSNRIIERRKVSVGGSTSLIADCKLIIKRALEQVAQSIIVVHNHPSGNPQPSEQDKEFTARLRGCAELFDIALLDHVVVSKGGSLSFRSEGLL